MKAKLFFLPALGILLLVTLVVAFNAGVFHSQIERALSAKMGGNITLGPMTIVPKWPLRLVVGKTRVQSAFATLAWSGFNLELGSLTAPYVLAVVLDEPSLEIADGVEVKPGSSTSVPQDTAQKPAAVQLKLQIKKGEFKGYKIRVSDLDLNFAQRILLKTPASVHAKANLEMLNSTLRIPIQVDTDALTLSQETVKATDLKLAVGGLKALVQGTSFINEDRHRWKAAISAPDLAKMPEPPIDLSARDWRGAIKLDLEVLKEGASHPWSVEGNVVAERVSATAKYTRDKLTVHGPFSLGLQSHFSYQNGVPTVSQLSGQLQLNEARLVYQDMVNKDAGVPLSLKISAKGTPENLELQNLELKFWNLNAKVQGHSKLVAPYAATLHADLPVTMLKGAEKIFLPLADAPVEGLAGFTVTYSGDLLNPLAATIQFESLKFKDFAAMVSFDRPGAVKARGRVIMSLEGKADIQSGSLKQANLRGSLNLTAPALVLGPLRKEANQKCLADFSLRSSGSALEIESLGVDSFFGQIRGSGKMEDWKSLAGQLKLTVKTLDLTELRVAMPDFRTLIPKGKLAGEMRFNGRVSTADKGEEANPWYNWPLHAEGSVQLSIPDYALLPVPAVEEKPQPGKANNGLKPSPAPTGFLPNGFLTNNLKLHVVADVAQFTKDNLIVKGLRTDGNISKGHFLGQVSAQQIFSGNMTASGLDIPLLEVRPKLHGNVKWSNLTIQDAVGWSKPAMKDIATGKMAGTSEFSTYLPSDPEFMNTLKTKGNITLEPVTLNSVRMGQVINDLVKKVPMLKLQPVRVDPLNGSVKSDFDLDRQTVQIENFQARDIDSSELQLKGKVLLTNFQGDMAGTFKWAKPQVQGCLLEGNRDDQGRMVIPVAFKGDLMQPGLATLSDMLVSLGSKALQCEQKKLVEQVKKDGAKQIESEVKKGLESLFGH